MSFDLTKRHLKIDLQRAKITDNTETKKNGNNNKKTPTGASKPKAPEPLVSKRYANPYMASVEKRKGNAKEVTKQLNKARDTLAMTSDFHLLQNKHALAQKKANNTHLNLQLLNRTSTDKDKGKFAAKRFANKVRYKETKGKEKGQKIKGKLQNNDEL